MAAGTRCRGRRGGFSLLEMLVVLVIFGILAALTYPLMQGHIVRSKRVEAQAALLELMQQQERYFSQNNSYLVFSSSSTDPFERRFRWWSGTTAEHSAYELQGEACPGELIASCVMLIATPGTRQVDSRFSDPECAILSLTSTGHKQASGPGARCWP